MDESGAHARIREFKAGVVTQRDIKGHIKSHLTALKSIGQYDSGSLSFASTAHVTRRSNYLTQRAEIFTRRSNLTPQRAKNTVNDLSAVSVVPKSLSLSFLPETGKLQSAVYSEWN